MSRVSPSIPIFGAASLRQLTFVGFVLAHLAAACTDDAIVYPNRNLRAAAGETSDAGEAGEATGGAPSAGAPQGGRGGSGGAKAGSGGLLGDAGTADRGGAPPTGPVCGDGKIEPPEQCDDGNQDSGDGCSAACQSSCEKCEKNVCPLVETVGGVVADLSVFDACYAESGRIAKGPATGYRRNEVCSQLVDCIRQESCAQTRAAALDIRRCWCDQDWEYPQPNKPAVPCKTEPDPTNPLDPTKFIPGRCASLFQDASEKDTLADVEAAFTAINLAEGRAFRLLQYCDARFCTEECLPVFSNTGGIATISEDIVAAANSLGESSLGDLVADSQRAISGADFALVDHGFIQNTDSSVDLLVAPTANRDADAPGRVLWSEALTVSFGREGADSLTGRSVSVQAYLAVNKVSFTGQQIYDALAQQFSPEVGGVLLVSGLKYAYALDASNPAASQISDLRRQSDGLPIDKSSTYTVALSEYLTNSSSPIPALRMGTHPTVVTLVPAEVLGEYLKQLPQPVAPPELNRITRLN